MLLAILFYVIHINHITFFLTTHGVQMTIFCQVSISLITHVTLLIIFSHNNELCLHV
jgi:hypothetical protein